VPLEDPRRSNAEPREEANRPAGLDSTRRLLILARGGNREALERVFERLLGSLGRWAHGRLPRWARATADTADVVQQAVANVLHHLDHFEPRHRNALRAYLRQAVRNQIRDEIRKARTRGPADPIDEMDIEGGESPFALALEDQQLQRYAAGLTALEPGDRELIVARIQLGYSYEQIAIMSDRPSPDSARMAVKRAILRLAEALSRD
jgi:RNA polymerase sigma factor (sigma-70 family)